MRTGLWFARRGRHKPLDGCGTVAEDQPLQPKGVIRACKYRPVLSPDCEQGMNRPLMNVEPVAAVTRHLIGHDESGNRLAAVFDATVQVMGQIEEIASGDGTTANLHYRLMGAGYPF